MEKQSAKKLIAVGAIVMFSFSIANARTISSDVNPDITQLCTTPPPSNNQLDKNNLETPSTENFTPNTSITINPNPFSDATNISFTLNQSEKVSIWIIDLEGILIKSMLNSNLEAGDYLIQCNSENLNAGIYFLQMKTGETLQSEKLIVSK